MTASSTSRWRALALALPLIGLVGATFYAEPLDPWVFAGGAVILAANWINIRAEARGRNVTQGGIVART